MIKGHKVRVAQPLYINEFLHDDGTIEEIFPDKFEDGSPKVVNIDQFSGQPFMTNTEGFIINDIMAFEESQSDTVARSVLARIKVIKSDSLPADMPVGEAFKRVLPASMQSPAELVRCEQVFAEQMYNDAKAAKALEDSKKNVIDFSEPDSKDE